MRIGRANGVPYINGRDGDDHVRTALACVQLDSELQ